MDTRKLLNELCLAIRNKDYKKLKASLYDKNIQKYLVKSPIYLYNDYHVTYDIIHAMVSTNDKKGIEIICKYFLSSFGQGYDFTHIINYITETILRTSYLDDKINLIKKYFKFFPISDNLRNRKDGYMYMYEYKILDRVINYAENFDIFIQYYNELLLPIKDLIPLNNVYDNSKLTDGEILEHNRINMNKIQKVMNDRYGQQIIRNETIMELIFHDVDILLIAQYILKSYYDISVHVQKYFYSKFEQLYGIEKVGDTIVKILADKINRNKFDHCIISSLANIFSGSIYWYVIDKLSMNDTLIISDYEEFMISALKTNNILSLKFVFNILKKINGEITGDIIEYINKNISKRELVLCSIEVEYYQKWFYENFSKSDMEYLTEMKKRQFKNLIKFLSEYFAEKGLIQIISNYVGLDRKFFY
ncbi:MAG: hypothetical protein Edafosvirus20_4 [Edafosvirus sp.]|uniref:Uncharacterized protein n=1 Tax=Edafosvirus sp. TaxID=2487765 RepID=A0A3G4ZW72_9VIRU|nr:MAG: hypothetical protein Edafosvirus20_4 [Edafosvirus sp.]